MTQDEIGAFQRDAFDRIKRTDKPSKDEDIARAAGMNRTDVSKCRSGARELRTSEWHGLAFKYGSDVVLPGFAEVTDCEVVPRTVRPARDLSAAAHEVSARTANLGLKIVRYRENDGVYDGTEVADLEIEIERTRRDLDSLAAGVMALRATG